MLVPYTKYPTLNPRRFFVFFLLNAIKKGVSELYIKMWVVACGEGGGGGGGCSGAAMKRAISKLY